jgi:hypothetical protein
MYNTSDLQCTIIVNQRAALDELPTVHGCEHGGTIT